MSDTPVIFEQRCKICQMAKSHPELFKDLHFQVLEVQSSHSRAMNYINQRIDNEQLQLVKLNNQNMSVHFSSHIMLNDRVINEVNKQLAPNQQALKDVNPEVNGYVSDMVRRKVGNEVSDYLNLDHLRAQLMEKLEFLDEFVSTVDDKGDRKVDLDAMGHYTSVIKEIRACIVDLNKIRQSKQLMNMVIKSLVEKSSYDIVSQLSREYEQIKRDMLDAGVPIDVVTRVDHLLKMKLAEVVATTAKGAIEQVMRTYKL